MFDIEILNIFDVQENYKIKKPIRLIELFGGVGCQATALRYLSAIFEHYKLCEFDKYAVDTYNKIHNTNFKSSDVKFISANDLGIVDKDKYEYILTYSFPCTDISLAGKRQGMERDSNTSSSLLWEVERLLNECKELPQILLMENVIQIHSQQNMDSFLEWQHFLESKGYTNFWEDLNAKDYCIPQNRNRTFMISILGNDANYSFPKKSKLKLCLNDMLEENVDEKYYLKKEQIERIMKWRAQQDPFKDINHKKETCPTLTARGAGEEHSGMILINEDVQYQDYSAYKMNKNIIRKKGIARTLTTSCGEPGKDGCYLISDNEIISYGRYMQKGFNGAKILNPNGIAPTIMEHHGNIDAIIEIGKLKNDGKDMPRDRVYSTNGMATTTTTTNESQMPYYLIQEATKKGYAIAKEGDGIYIDRPHLKRGVVQKGMIPTIKCQSDDIGVITSNMRIRKLTPRECFRLMGFKDIDIDKITVSRRQQYKQAGNGIVVNVLMEIFKQLL